VAYTESKPTKPPPKQGVISMNPAQTGVLKSGGETQRESDMAYATLMKGVAQSAKNERIIPALGQQGLVG